jgi:hypothetical protein
LSHSEKVRLADFGERHGMKTLKKLIRLAYLNTEDKVLAYCNNAVVYIHFISTNRSPSQDTLTEIILERMVRLEHRIEELRYENYVASLLEISEDGGNDEKNV